MLGQLTARRSRLLAVLLGLFLILGIFQMPAAGAEGSITIDQISVNKQNVYPGETLRATITWTNETDYVVAVTVKCTGGSTNYSQPVNLGPSGSAQVDFNIGYAASPGNYSVTVATGGSLLQSLTNAFTVHENVVTVKDVTPSGTAPVEVYAGDTVNVNFKYSSPADTKAKIVIGSLVSKTINLNRTGSFATAGTSLVIPAGAAAGDYNLGLSFDGSGTALTEPKAVRVKNKPTVELSITSPTKSNPATVSPGSSVTVKYNYKATNDTPVYVRLAQGSSTSLVSKEVLLDQDKTSGSTVLAVPAGAPLGKYNLTVIPKAGGGALDAEQEAVVVEYDVKANIASPTDSKPVSVTAGEKVTITFYYTAASKTTVDLRLQEHNSDSSLTATVSLDRATSSKSKSVTLIIPSSAVGGVYDLVIKRPVSGKNLDTEEEAVIIDAKATAELVSPTRSKSDTVKCGSTLPVKFNYTSNAESDLEVRVINTSGKVLASASASIGKTTTKKSRSVTVRIPSDAEPGKYNLSILTKYSRKVLDTETQAVIIEDPVAIKLKSPTTDNPVRFNATGQVEIKFSYTADSPGSVQLRLLKPNGRTLVSDNEFLSRANTWQSKTVTLKLPSATALEVYDLEIVNKETGNRVALEPKAVQMVTYPLNVAVKFVIGQSGRWVNGAYQATDLDARITQNRTLLPIRHVGDPLGWEFKWDGTKKMATVIKGERQVRVWANNRNGSVSTDNGRNWKTVRIDPDNASVQPLLVSGRVLLPLRFVSEALDTKVNWEPASKTVTVVQE
ncbi:MAG: hypothetical protein VR67_11370 [Peptococcaceae bacterium BRH_c8a]|nr:MAG: hypothetical protein VR67_11370 [Peptococcaceae bacterium BRH_c8a]